MTPLLLALLAGCGGPPEPPAEPTPPPPPPADEASATAICLERHCAIAEDDEACGAEHCVVRKEAWSLLPERIRYDGTAEVFFVQAAVDHTPGGVGDVDVVRSSPVYVGVTLVTSAGEELDLAVDTRFEDRLEAPFILSAEVGPDIQDVIFGLWDQKIEPCFVDRPGCRDFGFVLDGSLATWPPKIYVDGRRQRIPPDSVTLRVLNAGLTPTQAREVRSEAARLLADQLAVFESTVVEAPIGLAPDPRSGVLVTHGHAHDAIIASALADGLAPALGPWEPGIEDREDDGAELVVVAGGAWAEQLHLCLRANCAEDSGEALDACFATRCE